MTELREKILRLPKAELHNHLYLGGKFEILQKRYGDSMPKIPLQYDGYEGMMDFIESDLSRILKSKRDVIFFMEAGLKSCIDDNIIYLEASVDFRPR